MKPVTRPRWTLAISLSAVGIAIGFLLAHKPDSPIEIRDVTHSGSEADLSLSPDGRTLAFVSRRDGRSRVWLRDLTTANEFPISSGEDSHPRLSPINSSLLFVRRQSNARSVFLLPARGGRAELLLPGATEADWSPNGSQIVFVRQPNPTRGTWTISVAASTGREVRQLTDIDARDLSGPRWSPDGKRIALRRRMELSRPASILILEPATGVRSTFESAPGGYDISNVAWLDSHRLLYLQAAEQSAGVSRAVVHDLRYGSSKILFWTTGAVHSLDLDRERHTAVFDAGSPRRNLRETIVATGVQRWLTRGMSADRQPAWSPDGRRVVFTSDRNGQVDLWEWTAGTGALQRLTNDTAGDSAPAFTPDGANLIWSSDRSGPRELWIAAGSTAPRQLTKEADAESPAITPNGQFVFYQNFTGFHRIGIDGAGGKVLHPDLCFYPSVSPDGQTVACVNGTTIRFLRVADGAVVPFEIHNAARPQWMPSARSVAFIGENGRGDKGVYVQEFAPGRNTDTSRHPLVPFDSSLVPETFAISPDGSRIVMSLSDPVSDLFRATLPLK